MKLRTTAIVAVIAALAAVGAVVALLLLRSPKSKGKPAGTAAALEQEAEGRGPEGARPFDRPDPAAPADKASPASPTASRMDRQHADEVREKLHTLFADAGLAWGTAPVPEVDAAAPMALRMMPGPGSDGGNDEMKKYIRDRMREDFFPMAADCYKNALVKNPVLKGKIILNYRIVGDQKVGGVVDSSEIGEGSDIQDQGFNECMQQSMLGVTFDAPPEGTKELSVSYPIEFSPDDEDGG